MAIVLRGWMALARWRRSELKERAPVTSAFVRLSNTERRLVERFRELGAVDYLAKQTTDPATLYVTVSIWICSRRVPPLG